jgi:biopolymer transport protein ExbB/TolQ
MLLFFGLVLCFLRLYHINQHRYLFDIDLLPKLTDLDQLDSSLKELSELPQDLLETPIVQILAGSLRRFQVTKNIESAASSIEPAMQTMLVRYENDMSVIRYIVWAVPSIGFLGTVRGIGQAMAEAETAVAGNIGPMTASLGTAFNSTFVALIISLILMFMVSAIQSSQEKELISVQEYVERYLISRITKLV